MTPPNGHATDAETSVSAAPRAVLIPSTCQPEHVKQLVEQLEVPFDPAVVEWRVTNTTNNAKRGQLMPYADPRAYTDRLNRLFTPAGWTRKYTVQSSAVVQRDRNRAPAAKLLVTCELTIFGIGTNSGTGEEWSDNENALTSAEAQAFKRAASCFGLGRYFYDIPGEWADLDEHKRPKQRPRLPVWATPEGWAKGLRATNHGKSQSTDTVKHPHVASSGDNRKATNGTNSNVVVEIERMQEKIGRSMFRGLLKRLAGVWSPGQIRNTDVERKVLAHMQAAARGFERLHAACTRFHPEALHSFYRTLNAPTPTAIEDLETLKRVVLALENEAASRAPN